MDSKHVAAARHIPHLHTCGPSSCSPPRVALPLWAPHPPAPRKATPSERGCQALCIRPLPGKRRGKGGRIPRVIGTVLMTATPCHCRGSGSARGGDPDPSQPHREHVPRTFLKPVVGVPWEGTVPPVPGKGRGKALPAVGKLLLSFSPAPVHPRHSPALGRITVQGPRLDQAPCIPPHRPRRGLRGAGGAGHEASRGCCRHWDKQGGFSGKLPAVTSEKL